MDSLLPKSAPDNGDVAGLLSPQCTRCSELLMEYIAAGNQSIDAREQFNKPMSPELHAWASQLLEQALEQKSERRKRLTVHQALHRDHSRSNS